METSKNPFLLHTLSFHCYNPIVRGRNRQIGWTPFFPSISLSFLPRQAVLIFNRRVRKSQPLSTSFVFLPIMLACPVQCPSWSGDYQCKAPTPSYCPPSSLHLLAPSSSFFWGPPLLLAFDLWPFKMFRRQIPALTESPTKIDNF